MDNDQIVSSNIPVEYEESGPRYSESYLARVGRYNQIINRNSSVSANKSIDLNDASSDNDRIVIVAPNREFVEEDDKEAENTLIPGRFCQPESPTVSNSEFGDPSTTSDINSVTFDDIVIENHEIEIELKPPPTSQMITLQRQNSEEIEKNFGGLGPIKNTQIVKENIVNPTRPRTSGWAKLFASTLQRSKSTVTSEMTQNNQKTVKLRPGRKSEQPAISINSSISSSSTIQDSESLDSQANIKLEMRKKKRSIGVDMREKLNFFRKQQGENSSLPTSNTTSANRSSLISPNFMINLENVWKATNGCPSREQVLSWSQSFENILYDQHGITLFLEFLRSEFSDENLEFWSECQAYRSIKCPKKLQEKATQIFEDYVAEQSPKEINLDSVTRIQTASDIVHATKQTFDQSQKKIQALMEKDSYQRFLRSEIFHTLMSQLNISPNLTGKLSHTNSVPTESLSARVSYIPGLLPKVTTVSKLNQARTNTNPNLISSIDTSKSESSGDYGHRSAPSSPKNKTASDSA